MSRLESLLFEWLSVDGLIFFVVGVIAAIIGVMFGAAGFILLPAMLLIGVPIHSTVAVNKFATGTSSLSTVLVLTIKKKVHLKNMFPLMFVACLGGIGGAFLATRLSATTMNIIACIVLIVMFFFVLKRNKSKQNDAQKQDTQSQNSNHISSFLAPFFIGIYDGGIGPGSALLNITYFLKKQFSYVKAAEMTRFMMFSSCMSAFMFYFFYGIVDWGIAIPITVGSIVGSHIGLKIIPFIKGKWIEVLLPIIFFLLIVQVISNLLF